MVLPGMQDVHIHPISGGIEAIGCDLNAATTVDEYVAIIKKYADAHPNEPWIKGGGWAMSAFGPGALARKELIDAIVPDRPVILWSRDGHTTWVNSKALEVAGITKDTPDPPDGRIDRDPKTGEPSGSLQEGASGLVADKSPADTDATRDAGLRYAIKMLNGFGITGVQDASVNEEDLKTYHRLDEAGELSLRVVGSIWWERDQGLEQIDAIKNLRSEYTKGRIDAGTVKIMQDGVMENYTAVVLEPYKLKGQKDVRGIPMVEPELLKKAVTQLDADGFQVHFHAIGDGAVRQSLDAVEAARTANGDLGHRHHISHIQVIHPGRPAALPQARRDRELPAALGLRRRLHHGPDAAVRQQGDGVVHVPDREHGEERRGGRLRQRLVGVVREPVRGDGNRDHAHGRARRNEDAVDAGGAHRRCPRRSPRSRSMRPTPTATRRTRARSRSASARTSPCSTGTSSTSRRRRSRTRRCW